MLEAVNKEWIVKLLGGKVEECFLKPLCCQIFSYIILFIFVFVCAGLCGLFSSFSQWRLLSSFRALASRWGGIPCCKARASEVAAPQLWSTGLIVVVHGLSCSWHTGDSRTRGQTHVLCIGRQVLLPSSHQGSPPTNLKESQGHEFSEKRQVNSSLHVILTSNVEWEICKEWWKYQKKWVSWSQGAVTGGHEWGSWFSPSGLWKIHLMGKRQ